MTVGVTEQGERFYAIVIEDVCSRRIVGAGVFARCRVREAVLSQGRMFQKWVPIQIIPIPIREHPITVGTHKRRCRL